MLSHWKVKKSPADAPSMEGNALAEMSAECEKLLLLSAPFCQSSESTENEKAMIQFRDLGKVSSFLFHACALDCAFQLPCKKHGCKQVASNANDKRMNAF